MRKSELIEQLNKIEGDPIICISGDSEGNRTCELYTVTENVAKFEENSYEVSCVYELNWDWNNAGFDSEEEWEQFKSNPENRAIVMWP
jgi:hypothetical protein